MKPYYSDSGVTIYHCSSEELLGSLGNNSVDLVLTDPPYNCVNRDTGGLRSFDKGLADSAPVNIPEIAAEITRVVSGSAYVWCGASGLSYWLDEFDSRGYTTRPIIWHKTNPSPMNGQRLWLSAVECCAFMRKPKAYFDGHCEHNVIRHKVERGVSWHPTPKPVGLMEALATASSPVGGLVVDPYMGSGATLVASKSLGRRAIGCDISEEYCEKVADRLASVTIQSDIA